VWVAKTIESAVRLTDATGRLGGDEFAVLLAESGPVEVERMAARIRSVVRERVACSAGHACFPLDGRDAEEMLSAADGNLYTNKRSASIGRRDLAWASALADAADHGTGRHHSRETADVAVGIAGRLGWDESERRQLRIAALLHDVDIETVARIDGLDQIVPWIRHCGEYHDGSGEPALQRFARLRQGTAFERKARGDRMRNGSERER
jgi:GGDEF domain-containing protein